MPGFGTRVALWKRKKGGFVPKVKPLFNCEIAKDAKRKPAGLVWVYCFTANTGSRT
jgi:hypothetical protein